MRLGLRARKWRRVGRVDKRGPNYLAESGNIKANAISAWFLRPLSFFKPFFLGLVAPFILPLPAIHGGDVVAKKGDRLD